MGRFPPGNVALARALSKLGVASRSDAIRLVRAGRVTVAGRTVTDPGAAVSPERDRIAVNGATAARPAWRLIAFHKPRGVLTTRRDPEGRRTVFDLLHDVPDGHRLKAVGRLDLATSGLLLFTTDSRLASWLADPANAVPRVYIVTARGSIGDADVERMLSGVDDRGERLAARRVDVLKRSRRETHLRIELTEGKNREIRRLIEASGCDVTRLTRVSFGPFELGELKPGEWREIARSELGPLDAATVEAERTRGSSPT
jgi:23S rRNA pseudouridine2605 synthase